ncbi:integrase family protein [Mycoavidus cysteinexigens]|uniref:Integrase family protein n=1 Tax=Mycoavidus cysteinexigens TaxID=1553431 RepID=A0A2Z6EX91_9BURK|nr:integrase family protein [Mycoavidus cysteinexigens]GLR02108.1 hypothetical protein GCM10007934_19220 [Mycoavidus cysteinexigens]
MGVGLPKSAYRAQWERCVRTPRTFQFRDLRAKAGTDKEVGSGGNIREAQALLGHSSVAMTEHYVRKRGRVVGPTK